MIESQNIEWKESWRDEYLKWICGFANAQGGKIYIGTNDDGTVIGAQDSKKLMEEIPNKVRDVLGIIVDVNLLTEDGKEYIEICVNPNTYPVNYRGEPYNPLIANAFFRAGFIEAWGRGIEKIKDSCVQAGNPLPEYAVKKEDIMVTFKGLMADIAQDTTQAVTQGTTQVGYQYVENSIPMRIIKVIKNNPALSQSQIAEILGEKHDTIKYHMRKMRLSGVIKREGTSQKGKWMIV